MFVPGDSTGMPVQVDNATADMSASWAGQGVTVEDCSGSDDDSEGDYGF